ncbi:MAG TPA: hypothetical protein VMR96_11135, partial [Solirubrobacterales bacterium]|nr:hypothetical protein [Solirubrobacterales bacterium]
MQMIVVSPTEPGQVHLRFCSARLTGSALGFTNLRVMPVGRFIFTVTVPLEGVGPTLFMSSQ